MYKFKNLAEKNPIQISAAVIAIVNLAVIVEIISLAANGVAALNVAIVSVLGLFVRQSTVNVARLEEFADQVQGGGLDPEA